MSSCNASSNGWLLWVIYAFTMMAMFSAIDAEQEAKKARKELE